MAKFSFRGKEMEEISKMSLEEFRKMINSKQRRTLKHGFTPAQKTLLKNIRENPKKYHKTHCRDLVIVPEIIGTKIGVYSGKEFVPVDMKPEMLGHRLGEFVPTRKIVKHSSPGFGATRSSKFVPLK